MKSRGLIVVAMFLGACVLAGCAQSADGQKTGVVDSEVSVSVQPARDHLEIETGVESTSRREFHADWPVNVNDPQALREFSSAVISGKVTAIQRSFVDSVGGIGTVYSVRVERVYKGENIAEVISVALPGGTMPLGEYISSLDKLGLYEMKLGTKDPELLRNAGLDPNREQDPRKMDPSTPATENWGMNPTSKSLLAELQPDAWVFYIGAVEGDVSYGAAFDHALSYLKDGLVYSLHPEAEQSPIPESELLKG